MKLTISIEKLVLMVMVSGLITVLGTMCQINIEKAKEQARQFDWLVESPTLKMVSDYPPYTANCNVAVIDKYTNIKGEFFGQFTITKVPEDSHKPQE